LLPWCCPPYFLGWLFYLISLKFRDEKGSSILTLKMILFIIAVVFITGSLGFALWYRMDEDSKEE
jgi:hypothetical protein